MADDPEMTFGALLSQLHAAGGAVTRAARS